MPTDVFLPVRQLHVARETPQVYEAARVAQYARVRPRAAPAIQKVYVQAPHGALPVKPSGHRAVHAHQAVYARRPPGAPRVAVHGRHGQLHPGQAAHVRHHGKHVRVARHRARPEAVPADRLYRLHHGHPAQVVAAEEVAAAAEAAGAVDSIKRDSNFEGQPNPFPERVISRELIWLAFLNLIETNHEYVYQKNRFIYIASGRT